MSIFSKFFSQSSSEPQGSEEQNNSDKEYPTIQEQDFIDTSSPVEQEDNIVTFDYGCGQPIDAVYIYIEKDWEKQGLEDARLNSSIENMNGKVNIIREGLNRRFDMTKNKYRMKIMEMECQIQSVQEMGLGLSLYQLNTQIQICKDHLAIIEDMAKRLSNNDPSMMSMLESYKRGFQNGVAESVQNMINKK